ncbi:MAG: NADH-quinone oxidoreductase subunit N [Candidatus Symbiothrix sp.]|jgi:NADH-quinone oxidoreductase subunit N|nr:NADH-quinone oxidoreductase subunit N [Candidatus Symbiothrix sp.]
MDFSNFLYLGQEAGLVILFVFLFLYDTFASENGKTQFQAIAVTLFAALTAFGLAESYCPFFQGGSETAFGGMFVRSDLTVFMKNILNVTTLMVFLQANGWLKSKETAVRQGEFYTITLITLLGMYLMISANNFMLLYIGMETASLPLACLCAYNKSNGKSAEAGVKYVFISALSSGIMLFGLSFLYGALGSFYYADMAANIVSTGFNELIIAGFVFFFAGLGFKLSLVPFHLWTADVYEGAPTSVTAYLSVASKGAAAFALIFALYEVFAPLQEVWINIIWWLTVITITLGNLFAIRQKDIKRFFAFSSISQAGYIMLGIIAGTTQGMIAMIFFVLVYLFSNMAAFGVISAVENKNGGDTRITAFNGLYKTNPRLALVMMLAVFSLGGIPTLAGFFSKFFIFMAAAQQGQYILVFIALLNTVVSLFYYLLIIKAMFIHEPESDAVGAFKNNSYNNASLLFCVAGLLVIGFISCIYSYIGTISFGIA